MKNVFRGNEDAKNSPWMRKILIERAQILISIFFRVLFFLRIDESKSYHEFLSGFIIFFSHSFLFILFLLSARTPPLHNCSQALKMFFFCFRQQTVEWKGKGGIIKIERKMGVSLKISWHHCSADSNWDGVKYALAIEKGLWFSTGIIIFCVWWGENVESMVSHA